MRVLGGTIVGFMQSSMLKMCRDGAIEPNKSFSRGLVDALHLIMLDVLPGFA